MPRNGRPVCSGCGKCFDSSLRNRAKNILLGLFVSARSSKNLEEQDYICKKCYSKFSIWIKKGRGLYDQLLYLQVSTDESCENEIEQQVSL